MSCSSTVHRPCSHQLGALGFSCGIDRPSTSLHCKQNGSSRKQRPRQNRSTLCWRPSHFSATHKPQLNPEEKREIRKIVFVRSKICLETWEKYTNITASKKNHETSLTLYPRWLHVQTDELFESMHILTLGDEGGEFVVHMKPSSRKRKYRTSAMLRGSLAAFNLME